MDTRKVATGGLLLFASSLTLIEIDALGSRPPLYLAAGLFLAIAVWSLLADRHRHDRAV